MDVDFLPVPFLERIFARSASESVYADPSCKPASKSNMDVDAFSIVEFEGPATPEVDSVVWMVLLLIVGAPL